MAKEQVSGAHIKTDIFDTKFFKCNYTNQLRNTDQKLSKKGYWV